MDETRSRDSIRKAASDAMKAGGDIGRRVRDLTLESLAERRGLATHPSSPLLPS